ncbi:MAG: ABC transporter permease subunit [Saprospiraceae bacterium]|nr:ABC transporter permease subunit [Saprospiraceae bacterium]
MIWQLILLEAKKMIRLWWVMPATLSLVVLYIWSFENRSISVKLNHTVADSSLIYQQQKKKEYLIELDSAIIHGKKYEAYSANPLNPYRYNTVSPQIAFYRFNPLAILSTGQSDIFSEEILISAPAREPGLKIDDISNPLHRLYGNIDPSFILVFLLPLLIIALGYNVLTGEREADTLKLLNIQNRSFKNWIWVKSLVPFGFLSLVFIFVTLFLLWMHDAGTIKYPFPLFLVVVSIIAYIFLWCLLVLLINLKSNSSSAAAVVLAGCWIFFVFILPTLIQLSSMAIYKVPSRVEYITQYRATYIEAEKQGRREMLNQYFFDHPELAKPDTSNQRYKDNLFAIHTLALFDNIRKSTASITQTYEEQKMKSIGLSNLLQVMSPAAIFNSSLNYIAGTSEKQYRDFSNLAIAFRLNHLESIKQKVLKDEEMKAEVVKSRPEFNYLAIGWNGALPGVVLLLIYGMVLLIIIRININHYTIQ